jgi:hypothetical protein
MFGRDGAYVEGVQGHCSYRLGDRTQNELNFSGDTPVIKIHHKLLSVKIAAVAVLLAAAPAVLVSPAAADTNASAKSAYHVRHHARAHVRNSYASENPGPQVVRDGDDYLNHPYHCGLGLMNTPLPCEYDR